MKNLNSHESAGRHLYDPYLPETERQVKPECEYEARMGCYGKSHWYVERASKDAKEITGRGVRYDDRYDTWILTEKAYEKLCANHSVREIWDSMR